MGDSRLTTRSTVLDTIGNTPVVPLTKIVPPRGARVFVKLEYFSPTGSYKDRMALAMIEEAGTRGDLPPGTAVCSSLERFFAGLDQWVSGSLGPSRIGQAHGAA